MKYAFNILCTLLISLSVSHVASAQVNPVSEAQAYLYGEIKNPGIVLEGIDLQNTEKEGNDLRIQGELKVYNDTDRDSTNVSYVFYGGSKRGVGFLQRPHMQEGIDGDIRLIAEERGSIKFDVLLEDYFTLRHNAFGVGLVSERGDLYDTREQQIKRDDTLYYADELPNVGAKIIYDKVKEFEVRDNVTVYKNENTADIKLTFPKTASSILVNPKVKYFRGNQFAALAYEESYPPVITKVDEKVEYTFPLTLTDSDENPGIYRFRVHLDVQNDNIADGLILGTLVLGGPTAEVVNLRYNFKPSHQVLGSEVIKVISATVDGTPGDIAEESRQNPFEVEAVITLLEDGEEVYTDTVETYIAKINTIAFKMEEKVRAKDFDQVKVEFIYKGKVIDIYTEDVEFQKTGMAIPVIVLLALLALFFLFLYKKGVFKRRAVEVGIVIVFGMFLFNTSAVEASSKKDYLDDRQGCEGLKGEDALLWAYDPGEPGWGAGWMIWDFDGWHSSSSGASGGRWLQGFVFGDGTPPSGWWLFIDAPDVYVNLWDYYIDVADDIGLGVKINGSTGSGSGYSSEEVQAALDLLDEPLSMTLNFPTSSTGEYVPGSTIIIDLIVSGNFNTTDPAATAEYVKNMLQIRTTSDWDWYVDYDGEFDPEDIEKVYYAKPCPGSDVGQDILQYSALPFEEMKQRKQSWRPVTACVKGAYGGSLLQACQIALTMPNEGGTYSFGSSFSLQPLADVDDFLPGQEISEDNGIFEELQSYDVTVADLDVRDMCFLQEGLQYVDPNGVLRDASDGDVDTHDLPTTSGSNYTDTDISFYDIQLADFDNYQRVGADASVENDYSAQTVCNYCSNPSRPTFQGLSHGQAQKLAWKNATNSQISSHIDVLEAGSSIVNRNLSQITYNSYELPGGTIEPRSGVSDLPNMTVQNTGAALSSATYPDPTYSDYLRRQNTPQKQARGVMWSGFFNDSGLNDVVNEIERQQALITIKAQLAEELSYILAQWFELDDTVDDINDQIEAHYAGSIGDTPAVREEQAYTVAGLDLSQMPLIESHHVTGNPDPLNHMDVPHAHDVYAPVLIGMDPALRSMYSQNLIDLVANYNGNSTFTNNGVDLFDLPFVEEGDATYPNTHWTDDPYSDIEGTTFDQLHTADDMREAIDLYNFLYDPDLSTSGSDSSIETRYYNEELDLEPMSVDSVAHAAMAKAWEEFADEYMTLRVQQQHHFVRLYELEQEILGYPSVFWGNDVNKAHLIANYQLVLNGITPTDFSNLSDIIGIDPVDDDRRLVYETYLTTYNQDPAAAFEYLITRIDETFFAGFSDDTGLADSYRADTFIFQEDDGSGNLQCVAYEDICVDEDDIQAVFLKDGDSSMLELYKIDKGDGSKQFLKEEAVATATVASMCATLPPVACSNNAAWEYSPTTLLVYETGTSTEVTGARYDATSDSCLTYCPVAVAPTPAAPADYAYDVNHASTTEKPVTDIGQDPSVAVPNWYYHVAGAQCVEDACPQVDLPGVQRRVAVGSHTETGDYPNGALTHYLSALQGGGTQCVISVCTNAGSLGLTGDNVVWDDTGTLRDLGGDAAPYILNGDGSCTSTNLCENLDGVHAVIPDGYTEVIGSDGRSYCDFCAADLTGIQEELTDSRIITDNNVDPIVPANDPSVTQNDFFYKSGNQCVTDTCVVEHSGDPLDGVILYEDKQTPTVEYVQSNGILPSPEYTREPNGICHLDACTNLDNTLQYDPSTPLVQDVRFIPSGYEDPDSDRICTPIDYCSNIPGAQDGTDIYDATTNPGGDYVESGGSCDFCAGIQGRLNIAGTQHFQETGAATGGTPASLTAGAMYDHNGGSSWSIRNDLNTATCGSNICTQYNSGVGFAEDGSDIEYIGRQTDLELNGDNTCSCDPSKEPADAGSLPAGCSYVCSATDVSNLFSYHLEGGTCAYGCLLPGGTLLGITETEYNTPDGDPFTHSGNGTEYTMDLQGSTRYCIPPDDPGVTLTTTPGFISVGGTCDVNIVANDVDQCYIELLNGVFDPGHGCVSGDGSPGSACLLESGAETSISFGADLTMVRDNGSVLVSVECGLDTDISGTVSGTELVYKEEAKCLLDPNIGEF